MKKATYNKTGTRQIINSGWKEFDKQTNCISTGNVIANTQVSSFIRPWKETECNGRVNPEGHLMMYDLQPFDRFGVPVHIDRIIKDRTREKSVILYMFFIRDKEDRIRPFGWVLTDYYHKFITACVERHSNERWGKRAKALEEIESYITE